MDFCDYDYDVFRKAEKPMPKEDVCKLYKKLSALVKRKNYKFKLRDVEKV